MTDNPRRLEAFSGCLGCENRPVNIGAAASRCPRLPPSQFLRTRRSQVRVLQGAPNLHQSLRKLSLPANGSGLQPEGRTGAFASAARSSSEIHAVWTSCFRPSAACCPFLALAPSRGPSSRPDCTVQAHAGAVSPGYVGVSSEMPNRLARLSSRGAKPAGLHPKCRTRRGHCLSFHRSRARPRSLHACPGWPILFGEEPG